MEKAGARHGRSKRKSKNRSSLTAEPSEAWLNLLQVFQSQLVQKDYRRLKQNLASTIRDVTRGLSNMAKQRALEPRNHASGSQTSFCSSQADTINTDASREFGVTDTSNNFAYSVTHHDSASDQIHHEDTSSTFPRLDMTESSTYYSAQTGTQAGSSFTMEEPDGGSHGHFPVEGISTEFDDHFGPFVNCSGWE